MECQELGQVCFRSWMDGLLGSFESQNYPFYKEGVSSPHKLHGHEAIAFSGLGRVFILYWLRLYRWRSP